MQFSLTSISKQKLIFGLSMIAIFCAIGLANHYYKELPKAPILMVMNTLTLDGRGDLQPLHMVAGKDVRLQEMITKLSAVPASQIFTHESDVNLMVAEILFRWAEADMAQSGAYGPYIDARVAAFLKKIGSVPASYTPGTQIPIKDATNLTQLWFKVFDHYRIRLLAQTAGEAIYGGHVTYDLNRDKLIITGAVSPDFIHAFQFELLKSTNSGEHMRALLDFIDATKGFNTLTDQEQDLIMSVEVHKNPIALTTPGQTQIGKLPGKDKLPPVTAVP